MNFLIDYLKIPFVYLTQSLWRDEAFSYVMARSRVFDVIIFTSRDFNPPLYYIFLHFWLKFFGGTEISMRSLSFLFHLLTSYVIYKFVEKLFSRRLGFFAFLLTLLNPMLLYYAFEARMYSMLAFFSAVSMYFFYFKKWGLWFLVSICGIYTHLFFWLTIIVQVIFSIKIKSLKSFLLKFIFLLVSFFPWVPSLVNQLFRGSQSFWVNKIDLQLVMSSVGNIFSSYEGTPGGLWTWTALLSLLLVLLCLFNYFKKRDHFTILAIIWLFLPLSLVLFVSFWKPIFVNRYLIFLVIPMIFTIVEFMDYFKKYRLVLFGLFLGLELFINSLGHYYLKTDIRESVRKALMRMGRDDILVSRTPLTYFEANYYSNFKAYLYSPTNNIPSFLGAVLIDKNKILPDLKIFQGEVYLINDDGAVDIIKPPVL